MSKRHGGKQEIDVENLRYRELLRVSETAWLAGCTERHVENLIKRGLLDAVYLGRSKRVTRASLEALVKGETQVNKVAA